MNWRKKTALLLLIFIPALYSPAQTDTNTNTETSHAFDTTGFPQWAKDLRRWEIVAFGTFPFAMFIAAFSMDMYRWNNANGMDFSPEGRRYAPWPLKSAGAETLTRREQETVFLIAGGLAITAAMTDFIIVQIKRKKARKRAESLPVGTAIIIKEPWGEADEAAGEDAEESPAGEQEPEADSPPPEQP